MAKKLDNEMENVVTLWSYRNSEVTMERTYAEWHVILTMAVLLQLLYNNLVSSRLMNRETSAAVDTTNAA